MKINEIINENNSRFTLSNVASIKVNYPDADFWVIRRGSENTVGTPVKEFNPEHIGIKVTNTDVLDARYLYYVIQHLHMRGYFKGVATGTTGLKNIRASDLANIPLSSRS